jgi:hypothetical protein
MNEKVQRFQTEFQEIVRDCQRFCFMSRAKEFQVDACNRLASFKEQAYAVKTEAIVESDEDSANAMLSFEERVNALLNELKMWIALKEDDPNTAWNFLVAAQGAAKTAMQAHHTASHIQGYIQRLHLLEQILFPQQLFCSVGVIIKYAECSICGQEYGECDHMRGKAYMGKLCCRIIKEAELLEASLVDQPANKRCRVYRMTLDGALRDVMTWRVVAEDADETPDILSEESA